MVHSLSRVDISQMMIEVLQDIIYYKKQVTQIAQGVLWRVEGALQEPL